MRVIALFTTLMMISATALADCTLPPTAVCNGISCAGQTRPEGALQYNTEHKLIQYCDGTVWKVAAGIGPDCPPGDAVVLTSSGWSCGAGDSCGVYSLNIPDGPPTQTSTLVTSNIVLIDTNSCSAEASISGDGTPEFRICNDAGCGTVDHDWGATPQSVDDGQYIQLRLTTSPANAADTAELSIGGIIDPWSVEAVGAHKKVFITSVLYTTNLPGVAGADSNCAARATAAGLPGTFKAWIADSTDASAPATRFTQASVPYRRVDLTKIADNWADLIDGTLDAHLNMDEFGNPSSINDSNFGGQKAALTNVKTDGTRQGASCTNWTATAGFSAIYGNAKTTDSTWTLSSTGSCTSFPTYHLYCFEQ